MKICKNKTCNKEIKDQYTFCYECSRKDPYRGWRGVYESEKRKKVR